MDESEPLPEGAMILHCVDGKTFITIGDKDIEIKPITMFGNEEEAE